MSSQKFSKHRLEVVLWSSRQKIRIIEKKGENDQQFSETFEFINGFTFQSSDELTDNSKINELEMLFGSIKCKENLSQVLQIRLFQDCEYLGRYIFGQHIAIDPIISKGIPEARKGKCSLYT